MTYTQTVFDDFNDNSYNTTKWQYDDNAGLTESGGKLNIHAISSYSNSYGKSGGGGFYDITKGILAAKVTHTGTGDPDQGSWFLGAQDSAGNLLTAEISVDGSDWWDIGQFGSPVIGSQTGTGSGMPNADGSWIGVGNVAAGSIHFYKSSDGVTWTELGSCTYTGTFGASSATFFFQAGCYSGTVTYVASFDDASYFLNGTAYHAKVRSSGAWVATSKVKARVAGAWVSAKPKVRVSGSWVIPK